MDRISNGAITGIIAGALIVATLVICVPNIGSRVLSSGIVRQDDKEADVQDPPAVEFAEITNAITHALHRTDGHSHILPCANRTLNEVKSMTNASLRIAVARHIAGEILALNLTNGNYRVRDLKIDGTIRSVPYVSQTLLHANAPELERCDFIFNALQHFKEGAVFTLGELRSQMVEGLTLDGKKALGPDGKPLKFYAGGSDKATCAEGIELALQHQPGYLNNGEFRRMYPNLTPEMKEYFRKRFKEVFGIGYIPDEPGKQAYISGEKGTTWDGKGLRWRICDENNNWHDAVTED